MIDLVLSIFDRHVAPLFEAQGVAEFRKHADPEALARRLRDKYFGLTARREGRLIGFIEIMEYRHVALFFVETEEQGSGVGRALLEAAVARCRGAGGGIERITVNSSPNSVDAYERLGFRVTAEEKTRNGIRHRPMALELTD